MTLRRSRAAALAAGLALLVACSDGGDAADGSTAPDVTICEPNGTAQDDEDLPAVADVSTAMADLDRRLGGAQEYFEVNATARLVNLWVALNDGALAQPWVWVDGELTSEDGRPADGGTFTAADVDFDADVVLGPIRDEVPDAVLETFYVHGDGSGNVQYSVLASTLCGGGLDVVVGPDGALKSVDPLS